MTLVYVANRHMSPEQFAKLIISHGVELIVN